MKSVFRVIAAAVALLLAPPHAANAQDVTPPAPPAAQNAAPAEDHAP